MAATTAANQLKLEEMESACMMLFVKGFGFAAIARTMETERAVGRATRCVRLQLPQGAIGLSWDKEFASDGCVLAVDHSSTEQSTGLGLLLYAGP